MGIIVREIRKGDIGDILDIVKSSRRDFYFGFYYNVAFYDPEEIWLNIRGSRKFPTYVAEVDGKVVGFATNSPHWSEKNNYYIELLLTHPQYRGMGVGKSLIEKCLVKAVEGGYELLSLHTWATNRAMHLYERTGFAWIPGTSVYMINFALQLLKYGKVKEILSEPVDLIEHLSSSPKLIILNGHKAWKYEWVKEGQRIEAVFENNSKKLLKLKVGDVDLEVIPPANIEYLEDSEISVKIISNSEFPVVYGEKTEILRRGDNEIKLKAKSNNEIKIGEYKFGFGLETVPKIDIQVYPKYLTSPEKAIVHLVNNSEEVYRGELIIASDDTLEVEPRRVDVEIPPKAHVEQPVFLRGHGSAILKLGKKEKKLTVFREDYFISTEDKIETMYWNISKDGIEEKLGGVGFYWDFYVGDVDVALKVDKERLVGKTDEVYMEIKPKVEGKKVKLEISTKAFEEFEEPIIIEVWLYRTARNPMILIPVEAEKIVREKIVPPAFPREFEIRRRKLPYEFLGYQIGNKVILIRFQKDDRITLGGYGYAIRLYHSAKLLKGETHKFELEFDLRDIEELEKFYRIERAIEVKPREDGLTVKNNWISDLEIVAKLGEKEYKKLLKPNDSFPISVSLKESKDIEIELGIGKYREKRRIKIVKPVKAEQMGAKLHYRNLSIEPTKTGGSLKSLEFEGNEILIWSEKPEKSSTAIPVTHGGISIEIKTGKEALELNLKEWKMLDEGKYEFESRDLMVTRSWNILGKDAIMETISLTNKTNRIREMTIYHDVKLNSRLEEIYNEEIAIVREETMWIGSEKRVGGKLLGKNVIVEVEVEAPRNVNCFIGVGQPIKELGFFETIYKLDLKPRETKTINITYRIMNTEN
ncbi:MAG: GNAT family N-acetyltransferase [Candidatus Njordarchaeia archaeon]